jgi:Winged helix DNA-binding domain
MTTVEITTQRVANQHLAKTKFKKPSQVVDWFGAVQAQDYLGSLWAIGLRTAGTTEHDVEKAIADRSIVRTWPMRGTLHFVPAADVRWMLKLLTPRVVARSAGRYKQLGLDEETFSRSRKVFARALEGGKQLTRTEMYQKLEAARIAVTGQRGIHILSHLAQDGLICFAGRSGKQQTFALLEEWVPAAKSFERDEALAELAKRYFRSHGPATLQDFTWWSGLKTTEARAGLEMAQAHLLQEVIDDKVYWFPSSTRRSTNATAMAVLLPVYDEYTVAYKDRSAILDARDARQTGNGIFRSTIVMDGRVAGTWSRALRKDTVVITTSPFAKFKRSEAAALNTAAECYGAFLGASVILQ